MRLLAPAKRPARAPALSFRRPADGVLVEAWTTQRTLRSKDRVLDGGVVFNYLVAADGAMIDANAQRHASPERALLALVASFPGVPAPCVDCGTVLPHGAVCAMPDCGPDA